ncbi:MAG: hypothetical protein AMS22_12680 [Thiotrichales bacterium SG8_50]|nr:MAG: hypothetical protein AMS22_12680 [Thiotrichales bacterium SG8_50]
MNAKYLETIEAFTYEAGKLMKAIRLVQTLHDHLPGNFPTPDKIRPSRKPYDLLLEWSAKNAAHQVSLRERITNNLRLIGAKWNKNPDGTLVCQTRRKLGGKNTMYLQLRIILPEKAR